MKWDEVWGEAQHEMIKHIILGKYLGISLGFKLFMTSEMIIIIKFNFTVSLKYLIADIEFIFPCVYSLLAKS